MKKWLTAMVAALLTLAASIPALANPDSEIPSEVLQAAKEGMGSAAVMVTSDADKWEVQPGLKAENLILGEGYPIHYIGADSTRRASGKGLMELVNAAGEGHSWLFTLDYDGTPQVFMVIGKIDGKYGVVERWGGAAPFGKAKKRFLSQLRQKGENAPTVLLFWGAPSYYYFAAQTKGGEYILPIPNGDNTNPDTAVSEDLVPVATFTKILQQNLNKEEEAVAAAGPAAGPGDIVLGGSFGRIPKTLPAIGGSNRALYYIIPGTAVLLAFGILFFIRMKRGSKRHPAKGM